MVKSIFTEFFYMRKVCVSLALALFVAGLGLFASCGKYVSDISSYEITCSLEGNVLSGSEKVRFFNDTENSVTQLKFNLFGNAFRKDAKYSPVSPQYTSKAYPHGKSYGEMSISAVTQGGDALEFSIGGIDKNILSVELKNEVFPGESAEVEIEFSLSLANVIARTGYNDKTVNLANFYPILCVYDDDGFYECVYYSSGDPFYSDCADYTVTLTADSEYVVAASGGVVSSSEKDGKRTSTYKISKARSFAFVLGKEFESVCDSSTGVKINYYFYNDEIPDKSLEFAKKSITLFGEKFGKYPYKEYSVVQTKFVQGGMEFPGLVMISDELTGPAYGEVIVHETAHQWWQTAVGNNEIKYGFLDEGLAEYSVVLFYENHPEYSYTRKNLIASTEKTYRVFCSVYDKLFGNVNTVMMRSLNEFSGEYEYVNIAYIKSCLMFDYLRTTIGDDAFFKGLKKYYSQYCFKNADPYDLAGVYEKIGADTNGFFESFYNGKVII